MALKTFRNVKLKYILEVSFTFLFWAYCTYSIYFIQFYSTAPSHLKTRWGDDPRGFHTYEKFIIRINVCRKLRDWECVLWVLTPSGCWHNEAGYHVIGDDWRLARRRRTHKGIDYIVCGRAHHSCQFGWLRTRWPVCNNLLKKKI